MTMLRISLIGAATLVLSGCVGGGTSIGYSTRGYYDYGFRYSVYDHHHYHHHDRPDRPDGRPDRPRPPPGVRPGRPTPLPGRVPHRGGGRRAR